MGENEIEKEITSAQKLSGKKQTDKKHFNSLLHKTNCHSTDISHTFWLFHSPTFPCFESKKKLEILLRRLRGANYLFFKRK